MSGTVRIERNECQRLPDQERRIVGLLGIVFWSLTFGILYLAPMYLAARCPVPFRDDVLAGMDRGLGVEVPALLEGTIGRPGDIDHFRFKARAGQKLVFEVQTPRAGPPHFNLRLDVLDARKAVVLTNLHVQDGKIGTVDAKVIQVTPEILGTLDKDGEYSLRIRDLTSIHGSPDHVYRVLVRPQVLA